VHVQAEFRDMFCPGTKVAIVKVKTVVERVD